MAVRSTGGNGLMRVGRRALAWCVLTVGLPYLAALWLLMIGGLVVGMAGRRLYDWAYDRLAMIHPAD